MATFQSLNVLTGEPAVAKYDHRGEVNEIWTVALPNTLAANDTVYGPIIPANTYLLGLTVDSDTLDTDGSPAITFEVGYTGALGAFIATGNTTAQAGGIAHANAAGVTGYTATTDTQVLMTIVNAGATKAAGTVRFRVRYTGNP